MKILLAALITLVFATKIERLAWIEGCWERTSGDRVVQEQWLAIPGGSLIGAAQTSRAGSVVEYETLRIIERNDSLVYLAQPSGQKHASFKAADASADSVVFSNPAHDFPQRVIYVRRGADSLHARIEGTVDGKTREANFRMRRAECRSVTADEPEVRALDSLWARTYQVHDTASALQLMAEDFVMTTTRGEKDRATEMNDIRPQAGLQMGYFRTRDVVVRAHGDAALVAGIAEWSFTYNGRQSSVRRAYGAVYRRGGPLGWRMVGLHIAPL